MFSNSQSVKRDNRSSSPRICTNCKTMSTSLWRRNTLQELVCNACGLYQKIHQSKRPLSMKREGLCTRRKRIIENTSRYSTNTIATKTSILAEILNQGTQPFINNSIGSIQVDSEFNPNIKGSYYKANAEIWCSNEINLVNLNCKRLDNVLPPVDILISNTPIPK